MNFSKWQKKKIFDYSALPHHGKRNDMKIYEVEINIHDLADENYSAKNGKRYLFATRELAAEFVFKSEKAQYFLGGGDFKATRQMLLDNINDSYWYSIRQYFKAEPNEPGDCFDLLGVEPEGKTQYYHVIEREVFEALPY